MKEVIRAEEAEVERLHAIGEVSEQSKAPSVSKGMDASAKQLFKAQGPA